jgi:hypothetical protein
MPSWLHGFIQPSGAFPRSLRNNAQSQDGDDRLAADQEAPASLPVHVLDPMTGRQISPLVAAALCIKPRRQMTEQQIVNVETHATVELTGGTDRNPPADSLPSGRLDDSDRHYPGEPVFPDLAMIGRIETEVERDGRIECETRFYLCSVALCALTFARAVRTHRVLDVIFRKELAGFRSGHGPPTWPSFGAPCSICSHAPNRRPA